MNFGIITGNHNAEKKQNYVAWIQVDLYST